MRFKVYSLMKRILESLGTTAYTSIADEARQSRAQCAWADVRGGAGVLFQGWPWNGSPNTLNL